ncbi:MAG: chemotaxis protein CheA [Deltaproteobacteria bacterium]|nr:chemotaxis protein CheA [Deltaproteobacteria bacterium]
MDHDGEREAAARLGAEASGAARGGFTPAAFVDDALFADFLAAETAALGELERDILKGEDPERLEAATAAVKRRVHTMKGEAALVGAADVATFCHALEDFLGASGLVPDLTDRLLEATDWLAGALTAYGRRQLPTPSAADAIARLSLDRPTDGAEPARPVAAPLPSGRSLPAAPGVGPATVRVSLPRVDQLVEAIGELITVEAALKHSPELAGRRSGRLCDTLAQLGKVSRDLQDIGLRIRMVPLLSTFHKLARLVRDQSRKHGKDVRLTLQGEGIELDRGVVEQLGEPLAHLVRNAIDHGIEGRRERVAAGKSETGQLAITAFHEGGNIAIQIDDDGRGLDRRAIAARAVAQNLVSPTQAAGLTDAEVDDLIFAPGLSTASAVTDTSGRGLGMDIVRRAVVALRGSLSVRSRPGRGTTIKLLVPLTLAVMNGTVVAVGRERFVLPTLAVIESLRPAPAALATWAGRHDMLHLRGEVVPLLWLGSWLGVQDYVTEVTRALCVVVECRGRRVGLVVDDVVSQQPTVIRSLGPTFEGQALLSGAVILADGLVALIVNLDAVTAWAAGAFNSATDHSRGSQAWTPPRTLG